MPLFSGAGRISLFAKKHIKLWHLFRAGPGEAGEVGDGARGAPQETATWAAGDGSGWRHPAQLCKRTF